MVALLTLGACDPFPAVQKEGTIEAYEQYIKENEGSTYIMQAKNELEALYLSKANENPSLESYDFYLDRWPEGVYVDQVKKDRQDFLFAWAETENTPEGWQKFLDEYKNADKKLKKQARSYMKVAKYSDHFELGDTRIEQVNLAEDPEGPLNGWGIFVPVTNTGKQTIEIMSLTVAYLDADGRRLDSDTFPVVAPDFGIPMEEERKIPMKPGETREWWWTTGDTPPGWAKKVKVQVSSIHFLDPRKKQ
jgi:hypothetical protein